MRQSFYELYAAASGWEGDIVTDANLVPEYPAVRYDFSEKKVLALCPEAEEMKESLSADMTLEEVLSVLYDTAVCSVSYERVLGFYAKDPVQGETLAEIRDQAALDAFFARMPAADRTRGEVTAEDDFTCGLYGNGQLIASAGGLCDGKLCDVSFCVSPQYRGQGYGTRVLAALCRRIQENGFIPVFRAEEANAPSVRVAQRLGLSPGFTMEGALLSFPEA